MRNIIPRARLGLLTSLSRVHLTVPRKCTAAKVRCPVVVVCRLLLLLHLIVHALLDGDLSHIASKCQVSFEDKFKKCVQVAIWVGWLFAWLFALTAGAFNFSTQVAANSLAPNRFAVFVVANYMANKKTIDFGSITTGVYLSN